MVRLTDRHLCFVCASAYPLFTDSKAKSIGGVQTRALRLAKLAAKHFKKVTFAIRENDGTKIVNDHGLDVAFYSPVAVSDTPNRDLAKINADIYIVFESHYLTADVVRTCNMINKVVVHWATSVLDYDKACTLDNYKCFYANWVGRESGYCIYYADYLISQTEEQRTTLIENHGLDSIVIRNPIDVSETLLDKDILNKRGNVLWVGRADKVFKRPEIAIAIARKLQHCNFIMIMNNTNRSYYKKLMKMLPDNVEVIEYVPHERLREYYLSSDILLTTSYREGFSNVYLEAASNGLPIVSLEADPDGIFSKHKCGIYCDGKVENAIKAINELMTDIKIREKIRKTAFKYIKNNHASEVIEKRFVNYFSSIPMKVENKMKWAEISFSKGVKHTKSYKNKFYRVLFRISKLICRAIYKK